MRLFLQYLRGKAGKIAAFFLFAVIFIVSFALYHLPLAAVWYPSVLCVILGLAVLLLDFRRVKARHETLRLILCQLPTLPETLPAAHTVPEEDYRALVQALCAQQQALETRMNAQYQDMLDYYTLWAHQIKTPIASMRLSLQAEDSARSRRLLQELSRTEQYVEMVLQYLRLDRPDHDLAFRSVDQKDDCQCPERLSDENLFHLQLKSHQNYDLVISIVSLETKVHDIKEKNHRCQG